MTVSQISDGHEVSAQKLAPRKGEGVNVHWSWRASVLLDATKSMDWISIFAKSRTVTYKHTPRSHHRHLEFQRILSTTISKSLLTKPSTYSCQGVQNRWIALSTSIHSCPPLPRHCCPGRREEKKPGDGCAIHQFVSRFRFLPYA